MRHGDLSAGLETTQASVIVRRSAQKSSTMRGSQAQLPLDSGKTRLNDVNTYAWDWVVWIGIIFAMVYYMFKWTTRYNLENFGYKSKRDWKREDPAQKNVEDVVVGAGKKATKGLKGIGRKIPSEEIKSVGTTVGKKMTDAANRPEKMNSSRAREEIEKYHGMMQRGVISESDFERKKNQLLDLDPEK